MITNLRRANREVTRPRIVAALCIVALVGSALERNWEAVFGWFVASTFALSVGRARTITTHTVVYPADAGIAERVEPYLLALRSAASRAEYEDDRRDLQALFDLLDGLHDPPDTT
jgi:hypothetical protein